MADVFYLLQNHGLGLDASLNSPRLLLTLHHQLEALQTMKTSDVTDTLNMALMASGCDQANVVHKPRLLSDNGASYISEGLANFTKDNGMSHVRSAPYHPQTQGEIERSHQTLKSHILLENDFLPGDLERQIESLVEAL